MKVDVRFDFYEQRPYIHSTQLLYALLSILGENKYYNSEKDILKIICIYKKMANKQGYYIIDEEYNDEYSTRFTFQLNHRKINAYYIEHNEPVVNRVPYDEINIIDGYEIDETSKCASVEICREDNLYNVIIALGKRLFLKIFKSEGYSSWMVGKFMFNWGELVNNPVGKKLSFCVNNNIDDIYTQSKIYLDDIFIGTLDNARKKIEE